jgi:hypothetical protein
VDEQILSAVIGSNEAKTFLSAEPLDSASGSLGLCHGNELPEEPRRLSTWFELVSG